MPKVHLNSPLRSKTLYRYLRDPRLIQGIIDNKLEGFYRDLARVCKISRGTVGKILRKEGWRVGRDGIPIPPNPAIKFRAPKK